MMPRDRIAAASTAEAQRPLTEVELTWIEGRTEQWIRFGRVAAERIVSRRKRIVMFRPGATFAYLRWSSNDFGTIHSSIQIVTAVAVGDSYTALPFIRPGGEILLHIESWPKVSRVLQTAFGAAIAGWLADPQVVEIMLNPDGRLWVDRLGAGLSDSGTWLSAADGERIIRLVAHHVGAEVHAGSPRVSAELPGGGERFEGLLPPVVIAPAFAIRKPAATVFTLDDYVGARIMAPAAAAALRHAVAGRMNILVAGGTGTGKTTLANALLAEIAGTDDRIILIEDIRELQCAARNVVAMRTKDGVASLTDLVRSSLRLRPDRIPIGEVRGPEALDLLKAWGTGHPGGIGTIHAGSALGALRRMEQLIQEAVVTVPRALLAETIDLVAVLVRDGTGRRLSELARVEGLDPATGEYRLVPHTQEGESS